MYFLLFLSALLACAYLVKFCYAAASWPKTIVKTLSVAPLAVVALSSGGPVLLAVALALCAAGDYFLSRDSEATFMAGVVAFAAGHLAYAAAFLAQPSSDIGLLLMPGRWQAILVLAVFGVLMMGLLFSRAGALRFAVVGYIPIILTMSVAALTLPAIGPLGLVLPAALLFLLSDTVLSLEEFVFQDGHRLRRVTAFLIWSTYWLAQLGFVLGLSGGTLL